MNLPDNLFDSDFVGENTQPIRLPLPHGETNPRKLYSYTNPDNDELHEALWQCRHGKPSGAQLRRVVSAAMDYMHLTTYPLGQEHCVSQLRDIWRARRARAKETTRDD